jgi:hypothetical protein
MSSSDGEAVANVAGISSTRSQTLQKQMSTSGAVLSPATVEKGESDASGGIAKANMTALPTSFMNQGAGQSEHAAAPKGEVRSDFGTSPARVEAVAEPPVTQPGSNRDIMVRIPDATDRGTNVRFVERGTEVHVSVHTGDADLARTLRDGLSDLTNRLQHQGIQADVWRPGSDSSQSDSHSPSPDSSDSEGRRNQSGAQRDGQDQPNENRPRWVEELETSIAEPAVYADA